LCFNAASPAKGLVSRPVRQEGCKVRVSMLLRLQRV